MRLKTEEERELEKIVEKASEEGWVVPVRVKEGRLKGFIRHYTLKEGTPKHYREAWNRLAEIQDKYILREPTEQDHQESVTKR